MSNVKSPCKNICNGPLTIDGVCTGCFRTIIEVHDWIGGSDERKAEINKARLERKIKHKMNESH